MTTYTGAIVLALASLAPSVLAQQYEVIDLATLGGPSADAFAVNSDGMVTGRSQTSDKDPFAHAYIWTLERGMQQLDNLGGAFDEAYAINNLGWAVGQAFQEDPFGVVAVVWRPGEPIEPLPSIGGPISVAEGINDNGVVVGRSQTLTDINLATLWLPGEDPIPLEQTESTATDVNIFNDVVGEVLSDEGEGVATVWFAGISNGMPLESLGGGTFASDISNSGLVVGFSALGPVDKGEFPTHAVVWDVVTREIVAELEPFGGPQFDSFAAGVNEAGVVVGTADNAGNVKQAFIWDETRGMRNLNDLVDFPHVIREARAISETGWIAVRVVVSGFERAYVLKPLCAADVNGDGTLNILDFVAFQQLFVQGDDDADCNADTELNILDFVCYQQAFMTGCE